jgi:hypothetical protein
MGSSSRLARLVVIRADATVLSCTAVGADLGRAEECERAGAPPERRGRAAFDATTGTSAWAPADNVPGPGTSTCSSTLPSRRTTGTTLRRH